MSKNNKPEAEVKTLPVLDRQQIDDVSDRVIVPVDVPEWGGRVFVRSLSGRERDRFDDLNLVEVSEGKLEFNSEDYRARLAAMSICNEGGTLLYDVANERDIKILADKNGCALERICEKAKEISGLDRKSRESDRKN